jgi:hypothetical protein
MEAKMEKGKKAACCRQVRAAIGILEQGKAKTQKVAECFVNQ